ncbi:MAG: sodium:solute symporter family protein [Henriciella sp.]
MQGMRLELLIAVVALQLLPILAVWLWLQSKKKAGADPDAEFSIAGRGLPLPVVAATLALTILGAPHIIGIFEMSWDFGATAIWFGLAHVAILCVLCLSTGQWARRLQLTTVPELLERMYSRNVRIATSSVMAGSIFGVLTLEAQGLGVILSSMTGWELQFCAVIGGLVGVFYVSLAGMKGAGWMNLINASVMYVALVLATYFIARGLPGGNFDSVQAFFVDSGNGAMLMIFPSLEGVINFALALALILIFAMPINQVLLQTAMSAKTENTVRKALWIAAPVNGIFCVFTLVMGLTAKSLPEFQALGPKLAAPTMLVEMLPTWLTVFLLASFTGVVLSSFAMVTLAPATIFSHDIYKRVVNPNASPEEVTRATRLCILALAAVGICVASFLPPIIASIGWLLGWMMPIFWLIVVGLFWKRSTTAAIVTLTAAWGTNVLWSVTLVADVLGVPDMPNTYPILTVTMAVGFLTNIMLPGAVGYFRSEEFSNSQIERDRTTAAATG